MNILTGDMEKQLKEKFDKELFPSWNFEKVYMEYGQRCLDRGEFLKAKHLFDDILFVNPDNEQATELRKVSEGMILANEAKRHIEEGEFKEAIECLRRAVELRPEDQKIGRDLLIAMRNLIKIAPYDLSEESSLTEERDGLIIGIEKGDIDIVIEFAGRLEWRQHIKEVKYSDPDSIQPLYDLSHRPLKWETNNLLIEIYKGRFAGTMLIRLKKH